MTTETGRIRWEQTRPGAWHGYVGTRKLAVFAIWRPSEAIGTATPWGLASSLIDLPVMPLRAASDDTLKATAESWLEEFVSSLGAFFPDKLRETVAQMRASKHQLAGDHEESGHDWQTERCWGWTEALDWVQDEAIAALERQP